MRTLEVWEEVLCRITIDLIVLLSIIIHNWLWNFIRSLTYLFIPNRFVGGLFMIFCKILQIWKLWIALRLLKDILFTFFIPKVWACIITFFSWEEITGSPHSWGRRRPRWRETIRIICAKLDVHLFWLAGDETSHNVNVLGHGSRINNIQNYFIVFLKITLE